MYLFIFGSPGSALLPRLSLVAESWGPSLAAARRPLVMAAPLVAEHRLQAVWAAVIMDVGSVVVAPGSRA